MLARSDALGSVLADSFAPSLSGVRLGLLACPGAPAPDPEITEAILRAAALLEGLGARRVDLALDNLLDFARCNATLVRAEAFRSHRARLAQRSRDYGETTRRRLQAGASITAETYGDALDQRLRLAGRLDGLLQGQDILVAPVTLSTAPRFDSAAELATSDDVTYRAPFNLTGHPALALCVGFSRAGLPMAMQIVGRRGEDEALFHVARVYQRITEWHLRRPAPASTENGNTTC